jgi:hypothetical protein
MVGDEILSFFFSSAEWLGSKLLSSTKWFFFFEMIWNRIPSFLSSAEWLGMFSVPLNRQNSDGVNQNICMFHLPRNNFFLQKWQSYLNKRTSYKIKVNNLKKKWTMFKKRFETCADVKYSFMRTTYTLSLKTWIFLITKSGLPTTYYFSTGPLNENCPVEKKKT